MDTRSNDFKEKGNNCMKRQDYLSAVDYYKKGLAHDAKNPILNCNISQAYLSLKKFNEAEKYAKIAIDLQNDYTKAYFRAAKAALERHDVFDCMSYLVRGVQNCEDNLEDLFAMARELSEEFEKALRNLTTVGKGKPKTGNLGLKTRINHRKEAESKDTDSSIASQGMINVSERDIKDNEIKKEAESKKKEQDLKKDLERKVIEQKDREQREKETREAEKKKREEAQEKQKVKAKGESKTFTVSELHSQMQEGSMALLKGLNHKAVECFKKVLDFINTRKSPQNLDLDNMDLVVIPFALSQALILSDEYKDVVKGIQILENLEKEGKHLKFPAIFLLLGRAFMRLNRFEHAQQPLERGLSFINRGTAFTRYSWPGTYDVIEWTDKNILKKALEGDLRECKVYHKPDCFCCYGKCLSLSQHILPSKHIFFSDLDFSGYVSLECQERCLTNFHTSCWKEYKESLSEVMKFTEKDILGRHCLTPDCLASNGKKSIIIKVSIFGPDGEEKSTCKFNPTISAHSMPKETVKVVEKSPRKKPLSKKKEADKIVRHSEKKSKIDSKIKNETQSNNASAEVGAVSNEDRLGAAIQKLSLAREKNFGFDDDLHDPRKYHPVCTVLTAGKDEEFIYSFFLEIFKKEGYMSLEKLKEHWETNKEILPDLQPALVTFTDLARFLLDSKMFAIVHDTIGLISDLPNIYAIVQSKSEISEIEKVKTWDPSPATALEVNKSMTFATTQSSCGAVYEEHKMGCITSDSESAMSLEGSNDKILNVPSPLAGQNSAEAKINVPVDIRKPMHVDENLGSTSKENCVQESLKKSDVCVDVLSQGGASEKTLLLHPKVANQNSSELCNGLIQKLYNGEATQSESRDICLTQKKVSWKPRAKLLEWATSAFPHETQARLWKALTIVRSQNNNTLSQLSYDAIGSRVKATLMILDGEAGI